jgi:hypothetical protein
MKMNSPPTGRRSVRRLAQIGAVTMTVARVSLKTALKWFFPPTRECRGGNGGVYGTLIGIRSKGGHIIGGIGIKSP